MPWIGPVFGAVAGPVVSGLMGGGGGGGYSSNQGNSGPQFYIPTGVSQADANWQNAYAQALSLVNTEHSQTFPLYQQSLDASQAINYQPLQSAANQAGQDYQWLSNVSGNQGQQYGQEAALVGGQQQNLYNAGNQVYQTALDPQNAFYNRTAQQIQDQVRAGQSARGLGNSAVGAAEENQAMSNFNIDWQNQQLARQAQGAQAMAGASQAGGAQGQLLGADLAAQMGAYGAIPGYILQSGQIPIQTQKTIAGMPAQNAASYASNLAKDMSLYEQLMGQTIPYMNYGQGATGSAYNAFAGQQQNQQQQSAAMGNVIGNAISQSGVGGWLNKNIFGGGNTGYDNPYGVMSQASALNDFTTGWDPSNYG